MSRLLPIGIFAVTLCLAALLGEASASVTFTFAEIAGDVTMTSSGILDTSRLVSVTLLDGWGGTGIEGNGPGDIDIMGGTNFGDIDAQFAFNIGTDASAITNPGGPFTFSSFPGVVVTGSTSFTTYSGFVLGLRQPGIGVTAADIIGGLWTPDQNWTFGGQSFASMGLNAGTYAVSDFLTGETITIQVGEGTVPEPSTLAIWGGIMGLFGLTAAVRSKRSQSATAR